VTYSVRLLSEQSDSGSLYSRAQGDASATNGHTALYTFYPLQDVISLENHYPKTVILILIPHYPVTSELF
jgi:hypothetical protein